MKKLGYLLSVSTFALIAASPKAYADASSDAEITALKAQLTEMAAQQKKAAAVIENLAAQVDKLQRQNSAQASKVSDIQKQSSAQAAKVSEIQKQQAVQTTQVVKLAKAEPAGHDGGAYFSVFGGWGRGGNGTARQLGTAYFTEAEGGPQSINATGRIKSGNMGVLGAQAGYEWSYDSNLLPAVEVEALHLTRTKQNGTLVNQDTMRLTEHVFSDSLPTDTSVLLANAVVGFRTPYETITPYVGGGIGAAYITVHGASSSQLSPAEPGVNHFNSDRDSSVLTAAAQLKTGVRMAVSDNTFLFGEYRYLYVAAHDQTLGAAMYPTHAPTSPWTVSSDGTSYNLLTAGLGVHF